MRGKLYTLPGGVDTLKTYMRKFAQEGMCSHYVRRLGEIALERNGSKDQVVAVHSFLQSTFLYQPDPVERELLISPIRFAEDYILDGVAHRGDCDDLATLGSAVLGSLGYKTRLLIVSYEVEPEHAYAEVWTDELGWISFDLASIGRPLGWDSNPTRVWYIAW